MLSLEQSTSDFTSNDLPEDFISSQKIHPGRRAVGSGIALLTSHLIPFPQQHYFVPLATINKTTTIGKIHKKRCLK